MRSIEDVESDIAEIKEKIDGVEASVKNAEGKIEEAEKGGNETAVQRWWKREEQLRKEKELLLEERARLQPAGGLDNSGLESIRNMLEPIRQACVENVSATMSASRATKDKIRTIEEALGVIPGPMADIEQLLGAGPGEDSAGFDWLGKNDEVLIIQSYHGVPELGAVLGVELKKKLTWQAILQMEAEFYLWSASSVVPYVQSVTDLISGGVVCYLEIIGGKRILRYKAFSSMDDFFDYLASVIKALPSAKELTDGASPYPDELVSPKRMKLKVTGVRSAEGGSTQKEVWKLLWELQQDERDIACLEDVERMEDWGVQSTPVPSYFA